jgi:hypothetical protein
MDPERVWHHIDLPDFAYVIYIVFHTILTTSERSMVHVVYDISPLSITTFSTAWSGANSQTHLCVRINGNVSSTIMM